MSTRINTPLAVPDRVRKVMRLLTVAAANNSPCPTNSEIAVAIGAKSMSAGANAIGLLESANLIRVERTNSRRVVTIVSTGKRTAGRIVNGRNYVKRSEGHSSARKAALNIWTPALDDRLMDLVSEDRDFASIAAELDLPERICSIRFDQLAAEIGSQAI